MKLINRILMVTSLVTMLSISASAYIDPSVTTYAIQAIAGIVIAVGAGIGIYWRRAKKKVSEKLGIDENANKEVESDVIEFTDNVHLIADKDESGEKHI